jgi:hypothetical protein
MKMNRYIAYFISAIFALSAISCQEELKYQPGEPDHENCYGVYFPSQNGTGDLQIEPTDSRVLTYTVRRTNTDGELHVPVKIVDTAQVFSVTEIHFKDEEPVAELQVYFPSIELGKTYECTLQIDGDEFVSKYSQNSSSLRFSVTMIKWNTLLGPNGETTGKYRDAVFQDWFSVSDANAECNVQIQERDDMPGYYRIFDVYGANYMSALFGGNMSSNCVYQSYMYINATDPDKVWIPTFKCGLILHSDYGEISIGSYVTENAADFGASISSVYGTLREGVIEFPSGALQMKLEMLGWYSANATGKHRIILPGYSAKDYDVELTAGVSDENGKVPVKVDFGKDVSQVWMATYEGTLTETAAAEKAQQMLAGNAGTEITKVKKEATYDFSFAKTGMYSVVAIALDASGNIKSSANIAFGYLSAADAMTDAKQVIVTCGLTVSDKYAQEGLTAKNSLELYINGKNIQRLHAGIYEKSQWDRDSLSLINEIRGTQFSKSYLDLVNGTGLSLKQGYLVPGTEYVLVVEAYNGYREKLFVANATTDGKWDPRLAHYDLGDINTDLIPANQDGYYGNYRYYGIEAGRYSREYLGDASVYVGSGDMSGYTFATIEGLFPNARKNFNMKDDRLTFIYLDGFLYNYGQVFEHFVYEGAFYYPQALMYTQTGSAYGGMIGLMGGFVADGILAIVDSGQFAQYGEVCDGFALIAYSDMNHTVYSGLLEIVTEMLLIRPDIDDELIAKNGTLLPETEDKDETVSMSQMAQFSNLIVRGPINCVETFDGFIRSAIDQIRSGKYYKNYLDMSNLQVTSDFTLKAASYNAESVN